MQFDKLLIMQYLDEQTEDVIGVDIIGITQNQRKPIASIPCLDEALDWTNRQNVPVDIDYTYAEEHGDTILFNLYTSEYFNQH